MTSKADKRGETARQEDGKTSQYVHPSASPIGDTKQLCGCLGDTKTASAWAVQCSLRAHGKRSLSSTNLQMGLEKLFKEQTWQQVPS